ncbi:disease resistance protein RPP13-like protein [Carex littledalei]|uniref:Disease resistance protein RPP13-like protein n=1 Tax=Carex littledalei TaxID=544730 RepID=A0A833VIU6_9POAL|nr:disease resistance protein RPP13-like protein [Carex littledalei]
MAEVVTSSVSTALANLAALLLKKYEELQAVRGEIELMEKDLLLIQALLRDADSKRDKNELVTLWLNEVRDIADTIATVIRTFREKIEENCAANITKNLNRILKRGLQLGIQDKLAALDDVDDSEPSDMVDDPEVVGFEDDKEKIIEQLLDRKISRRTVLSIVGTGGLGKTTLAKKVYKSAKLEGQFNCRAWLSISQKYNLNDLLREILYSVDPQMKNKNPPITDRDLPLKLKSSLSSKRYLIILDDVWDKDLWEQLEVALPDPDNASRVLITTRLDNVAKVADCNTDMYKLHYLNDDEGLALLFRKAFQQQIQPANYRPDLLEVAKKLTKKCGGLPLALVVLGGILRTKDRTYSDWSEVEETMDWTSEDGEKCMKILARSYEELPDHLKSCFLYFAAFPEDYNIMGRQLTEMWMAEEFIPKDGGGTMENKAKKCLAELVQRCLIQVTQKSWNGYCKYCRMHDLLRDLAIQKAKEKNFFTVFSKTEKDVNNLAASEPHRVALQSFTHIKDGIFSENTRSLLCFGNKYAPDDGFIKLNYSGFRLLRVLNFEGVNLTEFRQWPKHLIHLRYLGLRYCRIPPDMFKNFSFCNLETIDLDKSQEQTDEEYEEESIQTLDLCDVVIPTLRHVYGGENFYLPLKWDQHTNLQTFFTMIQIELVVQLGCCINLRTLGIAIPENLDNERALKEWQNLKGVLRMTEQLVSLCIQTIGFLPFGGTTDLPCHEKIQKLSLSGEWGRNIFVPSVEMFPTNLTKLKLRYTRLEKDPMFILERLQSLRILHLGINSYMGTELICSTGGFPNLKNLKLKFLPNLCHWDIKVGAMPILTHLEINSCWKLHTLPELQKVRTLQELLVKYPSNELDESMQGKDLYKIQHIQRIKR